jgi:hypothetical protein
MLALAVVLSVFGPPPVVIEVARSTPVVEMDEPRSARVDARGASRIVIRGRAGWLRVEGKEGTTEVVAEGIARAPGEDLLRDVTLTGTREGDVVRIVVSMPDMKHRDWDEWNSGPSLDLTVNVPANIPVEIEDSSGDVRVVGTAAVDVKDGSGDIEMRDIGGAVRIVDGSGEIDVEDVRGDISIQDGSGEIHIRNTTGSVTLEDSSGSILVRGITGTVHVRRDSSGGIRVVDVGGDLVVERRREKGVSYSGVKGRVRIGS